MWIIFVFSLFQLKKTSLVLHTSDDWKKDESIIFGVSVRKSQHNEVFSKVILHDGMKFRT